MPDFLVAPWPWYVVGPLLGLFPALFLLVGNRMFGVSSNLRHMCAAVLPGQQEYLRYDWRRETWNLLFVLGILLGGLIAGTLLRNPEPVAIAPATQASLGALGIRDFTGLMPDDLFTWTALGRPAAWVLLVAGGFLIGFGTAWAGGCTSGHGLSGVADLQPASVLALAAFFAGGIIGTYLLLPIVLGGFG
ncbi:MAG TPA: YeeE/YedE thiosulfate transporter family protein [Vicinamibacterales bacterium]|nr:YeeE/YedE thiosulfate transporter family protein [Vicinamibacterales bacterium]